MKLHIIITLFLSLLIGFSFGILSASQIKTKNCSELEQILRQGYKVNFTYDDYRIPKPEVSIAGVGADTPIRK